MIVQVNRIKIIACVKFEPVQIMLPILGWTYVVQDKLG